MIYFEYSTDELNHLCRKDPKLCEAIKRIGMIKREIDPNLFRSLISSVVSQQVATKAYITVWNRLQSLIKDINPDNIINTSREDIKGCGLSYKKTDWIINIAKMVKSGEINLNELYKLKDDEVISNLIKLPGIGVWSAQMLMIFSMQRKDVLSFGDLAIKRGMMNLYGLDQIDKDTFNYYKNLYSPYGSIASLYLWALS